jgi:ABC-type lipoprotein release transport system permease subunit
MKMSPALLRWRSLAFHARHHIGVVLAAAVAATVLIGALTVGDSVRETLRRRALDRIGKAEFILDGGDRFFVARPGGPAGGGLTNTLASFALRLPGVVSRQDGSARANQVQIYGVPETFWSLIPGTSSIPSWNDDSVALNASLAHHLSVRVGDDLVVRIHKPSALSQDAVITPRDGASVALRIRVGYILTAAEWGDFSTTAGSLPPFNLFLPHGVLAKAAGLGERANLALLGASPLTTDPQALSARVSAGFSLADAELEVRPISPPTRTATPPPAQVELVSRRIFLDPAVSDVLGQLNPGLPKPVPILTYLANAIEAGARSAPYSMVTAAGAPFTPDGMADDEILINSWLAEDLALKAGDWVSVLSYRVDTGARLIEETNRFRVRGMVPLQGLHGDRSLMPEFPGLSKAESTQDWDAGFELTRQIRDKDEAYWKQWRGTPKAFITLAAGRRMWANRFGNATGIRWFLGDFWEARSLVNGLSQELRQKITPADLGLRFQPLSPSALAAARGGQDFGGLFIGFSFFLIVSALLLLNLVFRFGMERRVQEIGTLLALGWTPKATSQLFFREGLYLAALGSALGCGGGLLYGKVVLVGLNTLWKDAVAGASLDFHPALASIAGGWLAAVLMVGWTQRRALNQLVKRSPRELLNDGASIGSGVGQSATVLLPSLALLSTTALVGIGLKADPALQPGYFFGAGALFLGSTLLFYRRRLLRSRTNAAATTRSELASRAPHRQPKRSAAVVSLLAVAVFLIVAVAANRLDASRDSRQRSSGTGGFSLWAVSSLPVHEDLNSIRGQERLGLDPKRLTGMSVVPMRVREGDDASCLNLNRAQRPRLLGVRPESLADRKAFTFQSLASGMPSDRPWMSLVPTATNNAPIPAIGDANSIQWALGKTIGDVLDYVDERGNPFQVRLVGAVANSILQGQLLISEAEFVRRFPGENGYRSFLIDTEGDEKPIAEALTRGLTDLGLETTTTVDRLNRFNAVQNTYLNTFQWLGGLGLLLGSVGLGLVVQRNVLERRSELALMAAVGFQKSQIQAMILSEHLRLLALGMLFGITASVLATAPIWRVNPQGLPWVSLGWILGVVFVNGVLWTWMATRQACRGELLAALRGE